MDKQKKLTELEKKTRERFVEEYMVDYSPVHALMRIGYTEQFAKDYSARFMSEEYTLNLIKKKEEELGITSEKEVHRRKIVSGLYREAMNLENNGSARVAAYGQIAKVVGIEAPVEAKITVDDTSHLSNLSVDELKTLHDLIMKARNARTS